MFLYSRKIINDIHKTENICKSLRGVYSRRWRVHISIADSQFKYPTRRNISRYPLPRMINILRWPQLLRTHLILMRCHWFGTRIEVGKMISTLWTGHTRWVSLVLPLYTYTYMPFIGVVHWRKAPWIPIPNYILLCFCPNHTFHN